LTKVNQAENPNRDNGCKCWIYL